MALLTIDANKSNFTTQKKANVTYQYNTTNKSFVDMYYYLKSRGITNCDFHLVLYNSALLYVDPRNPNLPREVKMQIFMECKINFWYFIREVIRIPDQGGEIGGGKQYGLHRGNLALNFGFLNNWNMFAEFPRQHGKTVAALAWYLWLFLFGTQNSEMLFFNKRLDDSKMNLKRLREYRDALPPYLQMKEVYGFSGKNVKPQDSVTVFENGYLHNSIKAMASARTKMQANSIGRGCTIPNIYWDEYAFIPFNYIIYASAVPAFSTASRNARINGVPYGILITTTPGDLLTEEGKDAYATKNAATPFTEDFYNKSPIELNELLALNEKSTFVYIRFTYKQLGSGEDYLAKMVKELKSTAADIQREVLLVWSASATDSPFEKTDLDTVKQFVRPPIKEIPIFRSCYTLKIYNDNFVKTPPLIGVDVAGGYSKDSSAISIVDSTTTELIATFNCNFISIPELAKVIICIVRSYFPTAIINIERNGGFGTSLIQLLLESYPEITKNLYFEIKERVAEQRFDHYRRVQNKQIVREYGYTQTEANRALLMELLINQRMRYHKDKFVSEQIYDELCQLEVKKTSTRNISKYGYRIEHIDDGHDDQIFSYLLALYIFYHGENLRENYGFTPGILKTEESQCIEEVVPMEELQTDISREIIQNSDNEVHNDIAEQMNIVNGASTPTSHVGIYNYLEMVKQKETEQLAQMMSANPQLRKAHESKYIASDALSMSGGNMNRSTTIPMSVFMNDPYSEQNSVGTQTILQQQFNNITDLR